MAGREYTAVEGFRFFLFLGVFVFHCISRWFPVGWWGVEAFLVIGAYFLTSKYMSVDRKDISVGKAFVRRIKRLYPVYLAITLPVSAVIIAFMHRSYSEPLWYIFSLQNFRCLFGGTGYSLDFMLGHFWYIGLDVWLFLLWLLILRLVPGKHLRKAFAISICLGVLWRTLFIILRPDNPAISYMIPLGQLDCWSIGGMLALNMREKGKNSSICLTEIIIGIAGIIALFICNSVMNSCSLWEGYQLFHSAQGYMLNPVTGNIHLFFAILTAGILRYCLDTSRRHPVLSAAPLVTLGGMTYELYCFHFPVQAIIRHFIGNEVIMIAAVLIVTYIIALTWQKLISWRFN